MQQHIAEILSGDCNTGITGVAKTVIDSALHISSTADLSLLRRLHKGMGYQSQAFVDLETQMLKKHSSAQIPVHTWHETVWSDANQQALRDFADLIREEVRQNAVKVAANFVAAGHKIATEEDFKVHLVDLFRAVVKAFVDDAQLAEFLVRLSTFFPKPSDAKELSLKAHLERPLPDTWRVPEVWGKTGHGSRRECEMRVGSLIADLRKSYVAIPRSKL